MYANSTNNIIWEKLIFFLLKTTYNLSSLFNQLTDLLTLNKYRAKHSNEMIQKSSVRYIGPHQVARANLSQQNLATRLVTKLQHGGIFTGCEPQTLNPKHH